MKILIVGDQHFRLQLPYATAFEDGRRGEWEAVKARIISLARDCDQVVLLGDNLNTRHNHSSVNREFIEFLKAFGDKEIHIIAGNHERFGRETALDFLEKIDDPEWRVYTQVPSHTVTLSTADLSEEVTATFLPYVTPAMLDAQSLEEAVKKLVETLPPARLLFLHHTLSGSSWPSGDAEHLNEIVLPVEELEKKYDWIFGGHIHEPQLLSAQTVVAGNIFTQEVGEDHKQVLILDTEQNKLERFDLPVRGIYKAQWKGDEHSMAHIPDNSIVKCYVTEQGTDLEAVHKALKRFDASIVIEQYARSRAKVDLESTGGLDLSVGNLLKVYSEAREVSHADLLSAMKLLESHENLRS